MSSGADQTSSAFDTTGQTTLYPASSETHDTTSTTIPSPPSTRPKVGPSLAMSPPSAASSTGTTNEKAQQPQQPQQQQLQPQQQPQQPQQQQQHQPLVPPSSFFPRRPNLAHMSNTVQAPLPGGRGGGNGGGIRHLVSRPASGSTSKARYRFLTSAEWVVLARGVGGIRDEEDDYHNPVRPKSWWWAPRGLPQGLYRDVIAMRFKYSVAFHVLNLVRWATLILQIAIGATLTALGSSSSTGRVVITALAAASTLNAGVLAMLQNSGLPERYRSDRDEFREVEDRIRELLDGGFVEEDQTVDQVLAECYARYQDAKQTVKANTPSSYTPSSILQAGRRSGIYSLPHAQPQSQMQMSHAATQQNGHNNSTGQHQQHASSGARKPKGRGSDSD